MENDICDENINIRVDFSDKDEVKKLGAKWNGEDKTWYIPAGLDYSPFAKWLNTDGVKGIGGLYVDLVPRSAWFSNLRSEFSKEDWQVIRQKSYKENKYRCSVCCGHGQQHPVEAHERWDFDLESNKQRLVEVTSLCPACHEATHIGLANVNERGDIAFERLQYINEWTKDETDEHIKQAYEVWELRNNIKNWILDLSILEDIENISEDGKQRIKDINSGKVTRKQVTAKQEEIINDE